MMVPHNITITPRRDQRRTWAPYYRATNAGWFDRATLTERQTEGQMVRQTEGQMVRPEPSQYGSRSSRL
jgi:hypothetical protein